MDILEKADSGERRLNDYDHLEPYMSYLRPLCIDIAEGEVIEVYRTQDVVPIDEYGQMPRPRRRASGSDSIARKFTPEEVEKMSDRKRLKEIGQWGLSCNDSEESAMRGALYMYQKLKERGASEEELEAYTHERGQYVVKLRLTCETGLFTRFDEVGHGNLFPYKGVDLEESRDKTYEPKKINYKEYGDVD